MERESFLIENGFLEVKNVSFSYKDKKILNNISFSVKKKESITIFGPNGSGKTTLIKIILGILKPSLGNVYYKGIEISRISERERGKIFSYLPQKVNVIFPLTTFDYLLLGRAPYINGFVKKEDREIVLYYMEKFNVIDLKDVNFQNLSEGEKQIITLIRTVIQGSEIIVLDEPLTHLDLKFRAKVLNFLKNLKEGGKTIISVFHELEAIKYLSDRVIFIKNGWVKKIGSVEELIRKEEINSLFDESIL